MLLDASSAVHLKPWLVRTLEPICDAEPGALADYILALLKHNVAEAEMRKELAVQLEEFLEKECTTFIDSLFNVLRSKSYLPYSDVPPPEPSTSGEATAGIPIPLDGLTAPPEQGRGRKRGHEPDDRDGRPPAKGPRINTDGQFSRYGNGQGGRDQRSTGGWGGMNGFGNEAEMFGQMASMAVQMGMPGFGNQRNGHTYQPPEQKRGICRDYHNNGYCARGATCKYSHGEDAVVPGMFGGMPMPFMLPGFPNPYAFQGPTGGTYDPHEAHMDMRLGNRAQRAPLIHREGGSQPGFVGSGELPVIQDLTPVDPSKQGSFPGQQPTGDLVAPQQPMDVDSAPGFNGEAQRHLRPSRGRGRGRGGTFGGDAHSFRPPKRDGKTLVVEKVPEDKLRLDQVNEWFKRFGTVTNVAIDASTSKALISFSTHEEAYAAWKSEDAVFGNRFVKVFWHRPMEGQGQAGAKALAASAPLVAKMTTKDTPSPSSSRAVSRKPSTVDTSTLAAKQTLLEQQIAEQKSLMALLDTSTAEEKKEIMARLRKLGEEMKKPSTPSDMSRAESTTSTRSKEVKQKELLDKELEMHSGGGEGEESTEALKAKLEKLKAEAASLGITEPSADTTPYGGYGGYRPYRGRARGFRGYRGGARGGPPPRASMKLDNRPKKLLVKDTPEENRSAIQAWFETAGQVDSFETSDSGELVIAFRSRAAAEQAFTKGSTIPEVGQITLSWYTGPTKVPDPANDMLVSKDDEFREASPSEEAQHHEEEVSVSRWGDDEDEDRM